jgi:hypothetical protein
MIADGIVSRARAAVGGHVSKGFRRIVQRFRRAPLYHRANAGSSIRWSIFSRSRMFLSQTMPKSSRSSTCSPLGHRTRVTFAQRDLPDVSPHANDWRPAQAHSALREALKAASSFPGSVRPVLLPCVLHKSEVKFNIVLPLVHKR